MKTYKVAVLAGDGIGPLVMKEALKILTLSHKNTILVLNLMKLK